MEELRSDLEELQEGMQGTLNTAVDELTKQDETLEALVSAMHTEIDELKAELVQVRRTRVNGGGMGQFSACPDVPRPKEFKGTRVFMDGLKPWAKQELQRRGVQDLHKAMSTAESLVEFRSSSKSDSKEKGKPKGASNLFISEEGAKKLGLRVERTRGRLKMVNSEEVPTCGVAKDVDIRIGQWSGKKTIEVIPLDDYDFVIGMDFLDRIDALLVPFADCICVLDAKCQCVVPVKRSMRNGQKTLSAMQLNRGIHKGEVTHLAALKVDEDAGSGDHVPAEVAQVLDSFKD
ncbi:hypothetical protein CRG98_028997, partial [Punica granatum]